MAEHEALAWAREHKHPVHRRGRAHAGPYPDPVRLVRGARRGQTLARLTEPADRDCSNPSLINHFPLRYEHVRLPRIPRFSIWCGTKKTEDWHVRFRAEVVVSGHLHMPATLWRDGVRFEEASLGYPAQWQQDKGAGGYLRQILPAPPPAAAGWGDDRTVIRHR